MPKKPPPVRAGAPGFDWFLAAIIGLAGLTVALIVALVAGSACAGPRDPALDALMRARIAWITAHSDLGYQGQPLPGVVWIADETLQTMTGRFGNALASYDPAVDTIYLPEGFDPFAPRTAYVLVHELAHYLQDLAGRGGDKVCPGKTEPEAYEISFAWQDEFGPPERLTNWLYVMALAMACEEPPGEMPGGPG